MSFERFNPFSFRSPSKRLGPSHRQVSMRFNPFSFRSPSKQRLGVVVRRCRFQSLLLQVSFKTPDLP